MESNPFNLINEDVNFLPHRFRAYRYDRTHGDCWRAVVDGFLKARRITADAFFQNYNNSDDTGFKKIGLDRCLNAHGVAQLPVTPAEDSDVTRNVAITDMTEVVALEVLKYSEPGLELPYPRAIHKELINTQHHGIDTLGYIDQDGEYTLYVIEVMASVDSRHPPQTVRDHLTQILPNTLNNPSLKRLREDLQTVHDESREDKDKNVLNGFIVATLTGALEQNQAVVASPVLIRRFDEFDENDWKPFVDGKTDFETAKIPSNVLFIAVECHDSFSGFLDAIKQTASSVADPKSGPEGGEE